MYCFHAWAQCAAPLLILIVFHDSSIKISGRFVLWLTNIYWFALKTNALVMIGGSSYGDHIRRMLGKLASPHVFEKFSLKGQKEKISFVDKLNEIAKCIIGNYTLEFSFVLYDFFFIFCGLPESYLIICFRCSAIIVSRWKYTCEINRRLHWRLTKVCKVEKGWKQLQAEVQRRLGKSKH